MPSNFGVLPGEETLLASWSALTRISPGARLVRSPTSIAAVFPSWAPLNNAIMLRADDDHAAAPTAAGLTAVYPDAGIGTWALWVPSGATDLDTSDEVQHIDGLRRDTTTLVMRADLTNGLRLSDGVIRTSIAAATLAGDEPVPAVDLREPDVVPGMSAWVMVSEGLAVAGAWSCRHDSDCGIYAVGTVPGWRRRGLAVGLVEHVLADAFGRGSRTATLQSTPMAQRLYESLGFVAVGRYEEWNADGGVG